jgi:hypothetical protein
MAQSFQLREQAERCRRLARDCVDLRLRDSLLELAVEYAAKAAALESRAAAVGDAVSDD